MQTETPYGFIYKLTNKLNNKSYVGQTKNLNSRWTAYKQLRCKRQPKLYAALCKYSIDNFLFEQIDTAPTQPDLNRIMTKQHKENLSKSLMGHTFSEETKKKMSIAKLGKMNGKKNPMYGRSGERAPMFGKKLSIEARRKISEARKKYWLNKHNAE